MTVTISVAFWLYYISSNTTVRLKNMNQLSVWYLKNLLRSNLPKRVVQVSDKMFAFRAVITQKKIPLYLAIDKLKPVAATIFNSIILKY